MEIITGVERRCRLEEKLRIVAEVEQPGSPLAAVARRHELSRGQLWNWQQQVRRGALMPDPVPVFVPVQSTTDAPSPNHPLIAAPQPNSGQAAVPAEAGRIEIALPDGTCIRVGADVRAACRGGGTPEWRLGAEHRQAVRHSPRLRDAPESLNH